MHGVGERRWLPLTGTYLADVLEMLDVHALGVHDLLDDVGAHLLLALRVLVAGLAALLILLFPMGAATALGQLLLVDSKLQVTHRRQVA